MPETFSQEWDTPVYKGKTSFNTGLFINGQYVDGVKGKTIEWVQISQIWLDDKPSSYCSLTVFSILVRRSFFLLLSAIVTIFV